MKAGSVGGAVGAIAVVLVASLPAWSQEVRIVRQDDRSLILRVTSPRPDLTPHPGQRGSVEAKIPGSALFAEESMPRLPYSRALIGVPSGMRPVLTILAAPVRRISDFRLMVTATPPFGLTSADGWQEPFDPALPRARYPGRAAAVVRTGWFRDAQVAEIRFYPVRSGGKDGGVLFHSRIEARVDFVPDASAVSPRGSDVEADPRRAAAAEEPFHEIQMRAILNAEWMVPKPAAVSPRSADTETPPARIESTIQAMGPASLKVTVNADGLYRLTPSDLTAAGVNLATVNPLNFRMENRGLPIPVDVTGEGDGSFDTADRVIFYGRAMTGRFTKDNVYWLYFDASSPRAAGRSGAFGSPASTPASFVTTVHTEQDLIYTQNPPPQAIDHWWSKLQVASDPNSNNLTYTVTLPNVDPVAHTVNVRVNLQGRAECAGVNPDHRTRIFLNGTQIDDQTWDGFASFTHNVSVSSSLLINGSNAIRVFLVGGTGCSLDQIYSNFFEVDYRKTYSVTSNQIVADGEGAGDHRFSMTSFTTNDIFLYDATDPNDLVRITVPGSQITGGGPFTLGFQDTIVTDRLYTAATTAGLKAPASVVQDVSSSLKSATNGADYILITPPEFVSTLQPLISLRQSQGKRVLTATTDDIYDEFNSGILDPAAIRSFLSYAYANYTAPAPQFVVLAGDAHIDYLDNLGSGVKQFVPARLIVVSSLGEIPSDNQYVTVAGGDNLPEMFIGRLPARSTSDLTAIVNKLVAYESAPPTAALNAQSLFVADNDSSSFEAVLGQFATLIPPTMAANSVYLSQFSSTSAATTAIINAMDAGALITTYLGHGSATQWAGECLWATSNVTPCNRNDQNLLASTNRPSFIVALNCINGYFIDLTAAGAGHINFSFAEQMAKKDTRGGIAVWAPTGIAGEADYSSIGDYLFRSVFLDRDRVIGHAATMAVVSAVTQPLNPADPQNVDELLLFGDPATNLPLDSDGDGLLDSVEEPAGTNPLDGDTDDDGVGDAQEISFNLDSDGDGLVNGADPDSDNDLVMDGTEEGVTVPAPGTDTGPGFFIADADPNTASNPLLRDTDGGGAADGSEDRDFNGRLDAGETNPTAGHGADDLVCTPTLPEIANVRVTVSGSDVVLTWNSIVATKPCALYRLYVADNVPKPKNSFAPFHILAVTGVPTYTHVGAASDGIDHDYLIVAINPMTGEGPFGHYGR